MTQYNQESTPDEGMAAKLARTYYDRVTWIYELGWGKSFHFFRVFKHLSFKESLLMHELFVFSKLGSPNKEEKWVDLGCGIGGPMRQAVRFGSGNVSVHGVNICEKQVQRCRELNEAEGMGDKTTVICSNFEALQLDDCSMDKAYAFEATCYATDISLPYKEVFRVLKPGGLFVTLEWAVTNKYDENDVRIAHYLSCIKEGVSLLKLNTAEECRQAALDCGFEILEFMDYGEEWKKFPEMEEPWYSPMYHRHSNPIIDKLLRICDSASQEILLRLSGIAERLGIIPEGINEAFKMLHSSRVGLSECGRTGTYTPMLLILARKPY